MNREWQAHARAASTTHSQKWTVCGRYDAPRPQPQKEDNEEDRTHLVSLPDKIQRDYTLRIYKVLIARYAHVDTHGTMFHTIGSSGRRLGVALSSPVNQPDL